MTLICHVCLSKEESKNHFFLECSIGKEVLAHLHNWWSEIPATSSSMEDLLDDITASDDRRKRKINIGAIFLFVYLFIYFFL